MSLDRKQIKAEAKQRLSTAKVNPYGFTLIYMLIGVVLGGLSLYAAVPRLVVSVTQMQQLNPAFSVQIPAYLTNLPALPSGIAGFVSVLVGLVAILLEAGVVLYHLGVWRGEEKPFSTLFEGFTIAGKVIVLSILEVVFIWLWSLLFLIPGIVAAYRYRFALYNLCENPELSAIEALNMSKAQTKGYKGSLFVLDLSFLGWDILAGFTSGILDIWLDPYKMQTEMGFFQTIKRIQGIGFLLEQPQSDEPNL